MRFASFDGERHFSDLVQRLFDLSGDRSGEQAADLEERLRHVNPHLEDLRKTPKGTPIVVPDAPDARPREGAEPLRTPLAELSEAMLRSLEGLRVSLGESLHREAEETRGQLAALASWELRAQAEKAPALEEQIDAAALAADRRLRRNEARAEHYERGLKLLAEDLEEFRQHLG